MAVSSRIQKVWRAAASHRMPGRRSSAPAHWRAALLLSQLRQRAVEEGSARAGRWPGAPVLPQRLHLVERRLLESLAAGRRSRGGV
jgi:hypothetical protein